jgi:hypothetical protein
VNSTLKDWGVTMRLSLISLALLVGTCSAFGQRNKDDTAAVNRACSVKECFSEAEVRDFEVIDRTHLIVYVGSQRCAFHVELRGTLCDLTFAPELFFIKTNEVPDGRMPRGSEPASDRAQVDPFDPIESARRERRDLRICSNDLTVMVHGGRFSETSAGPVLRDRFGEPRINTDCRVSSVVSVTDDQLVEFYVGRGVIPPVPPMGTGEIEVGEQEEPNAETPAGGSPDAR